MASEILSVPEERLHDVITVIRAGLKTILDINPHALSPETVKALRNWCNDEERYLTGLCGG